MKKMIMSVMVCIACLHTMPTTTYADEKETVVKKEEAQVTVIDGSTPWRLYQGWKTPEIIDEKGNVKHATIPILHRRRPTGKNYPVLAAPLPSSDWAGPDFDDSDWAFCKARTSIPPSRSKSMWFWGNACELHHILGRVRFQVDDPGKTKGLKLSVRYRGGLVVYLNGREIGRAHLPAGDITLNTPAEGYPPETYMRPDKTLLDERDVKKYPDHYRKRNRKLEIPVPAEALRKGINVLAVEIHRAPLSALRLKLKPKKAHWKGSPSAWCHAALIDATLTAPSGAALHSTTSHPDGIHVWNAPITQRLTTASRGNPSEPLRPIRLIGTRNGVFSGQVVISAKTAISGFKVSSTALKAPNGKGEIPAEAVQVRFAQPNQFKYRSRTPSTPWFDALLESPPTGKTAMQPIWVSVRVPADATAGTYTGSVSIEAGGKKVSRVPLTMKVHALRLPDPNQFRMHFGFVQSPETLTIQYGVPLWSPEHWKLVENSLQRLGELGNETLFIPLMCRYHFGYSETMVRWIKKPDGSYEHDFSLVEKYVDLATKHFGKQKLKSICFIAWDRWMGSNRSAPKSRKPAPISLLDKKSGKITEGRAPLYGTPESVPFWKPVFMGLKALLARRGLEKSMMHGISGDTSPYQEVYDDLSKASPGTPWVWQGHPRASTLGKNRVPVGYGSWVWGTPGVRDPLTGRPQGWRRSLQEVSFPRPGTGIVGTLMTGSTLATYRGAAEGASCAGMRGYGRIGGDLWPVAINAVNVNIKARAGVKYSLIYRFMAPWGQLSLYNSTVHILYPGRKGPVGSIRYEMLREGVQEAETRAYLEDILNDKQKKAKLGEDLAARCREILDERARYLMRCGRGSETSWRFYLTGLERRADKLFAVAAEVSAAIE